jgi:hypothetical protein
LRARTGDSQIIVDDHYGHESECCGPFLESILTPVALHVVLHLLESGLPDVNIGGPVEMRRGNFVVHG